MALFVSWEQRKLVDLFETACSGGTPTSSVERYYDGEIPFLGIADITGRTINETNKHISEEGLNNSTAVMIPPGTISLAMYASVGKVGITNIPMATSQAFYNMTFSSIPTRDFVYTVLEKMEIFSEWEPLISTGTQRNLNAEKVKNLLIKVPSENERKQIGLFFQNLDNTITLHQRKRNNKNWRCIMLDQTKSTDLFCDYYAQWIRVYKEGAIRKITLDKYYMAHSWLLKLIPKVKLCDMTRIAYQQLLNDYALDHERQTTMDFHHQIKGAILDAVDEGLIDRDPTRKVIIKGKPPVEKKTKYLNQFELHTLLTGLDLGREVNWDWFILLVAKTGMRFSEALALTPKDFDFSHQSLSINKTWNYKGNGGFLPTKNKSSVRRIQIDWQTVVQFSELLKGLACDKPIFVNGKKVYNSTVNDILERHCKKEKVPVISVHGLRHTHASLLLFAGVSIGSVARRLGHASMTTTQKTYLHIIHELENQDVDLVMRSLSTLS